MTARATLLAAGVAAAAVGPGAAEADPALAPTLSPDPPARGSAVPDWGGFDAPAPPPAAPIGTYDRGCLAGGVALPPAGAGFQVMRPSRGRYYGHPELIRFIQDLAAGLAADGYPGLLIGDLAQPRGGPMRTGHRSHQIGLDVDIWFLPAPATPLPLEALESLPASSQVAADGQAVGAEWGPWQAEVLRRAALSPAVDRIFVNPAIKRALCESEDDRAWLAKLRPWWGHDAHFHVRLACPADQPACAGQAPLPEGDGCAALGWWFSADAAAEQAQRRRAPPARALTLDDLPDSCRAVYDAG